MQLLSPDVKISYKWTEDYQPWSLKNHSSKFINYLPTKTILKSNNDKKTKNISLKKGKKSQKYHSQISQGETPKFWAHLVCRLVALEQHLACLLVFNN